MNVTLAAISLSMQGDALMRPPRLGIPDRGCTWFMGSGDIAPRRLERRWAPRFAFRTGLEIQWGSAILHATTRDVSSTGMFIESCDPLWVGAGFTARLALPRPLHVNCFVKRVEPGRGMGVSITLAEEAHQEDYAALLSFLSGAP
jgi:PilZ domain-containing protein